MRKRNIFVLLDQMLQASRQATTFIEGMREQDFLAPQLPCQHMVGLRNRIAHGYYDLDFGVIWRTATTDVSALRDCLERIYEAAGERLGGARQGPSED